MFGSKSISIKNVSFILLFVGAIGWLSACSTKTLPPELVVTPITVPTSAPEAQVPVQPAVEEPAAAEAESGYPAVTENGEGYPAAVSEETAQEAVDLNAPTPTHAVPTPVLEEVPAGQALAIAYAQDLDMTWQLANAEAVDFGSDPVKISFDEFLVDYDPWANEPPELSPLLKALDGKMVELEGYMAPPLKLGLDWFQLTAVPVGSCAFCSGASDWTPDIALVYVEGADEGAEMLFTWAPLRVVGELHIGENVDIETGMVSLVRIYTDADGLEEITFSQ